METTPGASAERENGADDLDFELMDPEPLVIPVSPVDDTDSDFVFIEFNPAPQQKDNRIRNRFNVKDDQIRNRFNVLEALIPQSELKVSELIVDEGYMHCLLTGGQEFECSPGKDEKEAAATLLRIYEKDLDDQQYLIDRSIQVVLLRRILSGRSMHPNSMMHDVLNEATALAVSKDPLFQEDTKEMIEEYWDSLMIFLRDGILVPAQQSAENPLV